AAATGGIPAAGALSSVAFSVKLWAWLLASAFVAGLTLFTVWDTLGSPVAVPRPAAEFSTQAQVSEVRFSPQGSTESAISANLIAPTAPSAALGAGAVISGVLLDAETGHPVEDPTARILAFSESGQVEAGITGHGSFRLTGLTEGWYTLSARGDTVIPPDGPVTLTVRANQGVEDIEVKVHRGGVVTGRVYDPETNEGIAQASLSAVHLSGSQPHLPTCKSTETGEYRLTGVVPGFVRVECWPPKDYPRPARKTQQVAVRPCQTVPGVHFPVAPGIAVSGTVVDEEHRAVADATIVGRGRDGGSASETKSGVDGAFKLLGLNPTTELYILGIMEGRACLPAGPYELKAGGLEDVVVTMLPEGSIEGRVLDNQNHTVPDARITIEPGFPFPFEVPSAGPDETGVFLLPRLAPGAYTLRLTVSGAEQQATEANKIHLRRGEQLTGIVLRYSGGHLGIAGRVTNLEHEPLAGMNVSCVGSHEGQTMASSAETDTEGRYEIEGLGAGAYELHLFHPDYMAARLSGIEAGARNADFELGPAAVIEGQVVQMEGKPLTDFEVLVHPGWVMDIAPWMDSEFIRFHDEEGRFSLKAVDGMGMAMVAARAPGFTPQAVQTGVAPGGHVENVLIRLKPARSVRGIVTDGEGMPIEGALVFSGGIPENATPEAGAETRADVDGAFVLEGLRAGAQKVSAYHAAYAPGWAAVPEAAETPVQIVLSEKTSLRGQLTSNGQPVPGEWVKVTYAQPGAMREEQAQTTADGVYHFDELPPGHVNVSATQYVQTGERTVGHELSVRAELSAGMETTADLAFTEGSASLQGTVYLGGLPVTGGDVMAHARSAAGEVVVEDGLDEMGAYDIAGLSEGPVKLEIEIGGDGLPKRYKTETVELRANETAMHDVHFDAGTASLSITVEGEDAGLAVLRWVVELSHEDSPLELLERVEQALVWEGESTSGAPAVVEHLDPGTYTVVAVKDALGSDRKLAWTVVELANEEEATTHLQLR
ncbi:MAG: carboxypeptidase regulatory-like domain-containing protein, partial [Candidatus Hydrogenedentes bacterium]|nr:carboxypeptidase regulatory-like domain-containing protein [Candidatus Hydrogenedentota bacterium]